MSLTHFNLVANIAQMLSPGVSMLRSTDPEWPQEVTVAVLPFFHIYAMNTIMTMGLQVMPTPINLISLSESNQDFKRNFFQIGAKIVTLPKFEPEEYIKALVTYKVSFSSFVIRFITRAKPLKY